MTYTTILNNTIQYTTIVTLPPTLRSSISGPALRFRPLVVTGVATLQNTPLPSLYSPSFHYLPPFPSLTPPQGLRKTVTFLIVLSSVRTGRHLLVHQNQTHNKVENTNFKNATNLKLRELPTKKLFVPYSKVTRYHSKVTTIKIF